MKTSSLRHISGICLVCLLFGFSSRVIAQPPDSLWQFHYGGTGDEIGFDVIEGNDGEYIMVGKTKSYGNGLYDGYLLKLDNNGGTIWEKYYGGAFDEQLISVCPALYGGYVVTGFFKSFPEGGTAVWILFINEEGDSLWSKTHMTQHDCWGLHISPTIDQGYIVSAIMATGFGVGDEVWLLKLDAVGDTIWTRRYGRPNQDYGEQVIQTSDGGYIIAGRTYSSYTPESGDAWAIKTNADGDTLWTRRYGGDDEDMFNAVIETEDGYIFAGNSKSYGSGYTEFWAVRTNDSGDTIWSRTYGNGDAQLCFSISGVAGGHYVLGGYSGLLSTSFDTHLVEVDINGNMIWESSYGHPQGNEIIYGCRGTSDGGFIVTGKTNYYFSLKDEALVLKLGEASSVNGPGSSTTPMLSIHPNPFNSTATISLNILAANSKVDLRIYNAMGVLVMNLAESLDVQGCMEIPLNASSMKPGLYFLKMDVGNEVMAFKMIRSR